MTFEYISTTHEVALHNIEVVRSGRGSLRFDKAIIFLNRGCNLRCRGCYVKVERNEGASLSNSQIRDILRFGCDHGARFFVIPGYGEPLMDPCFWPAIESARQLGMEPVVYTNATLVDESAAQRLHELGVLVFAKRNTFNHGLQDLLVGTEGASHLMEKGMRNLIAAGLKSPKLAVESYIIRPVLDDLKEVLRFCRQNDLLPYFEAFENSGENVAAEMQSPLITDEELTRFFNELAEIDRSEYGCEVHIPDGSRVYCFGTNVKIASSVLTVDHHSCCDRVFSTFCVAHTGDVRFCVDHRKNIGNIHREPLEAILDPGRNQRIHDVFTMPCSYQSARYWARRAQGDNND